MMPWIVSSGVLWVAWYFLIMSLIQGVERCSDRDTVML